MVLSWEITYLKMTSTRLFSPPGNFSMVMPLQELLSISLSYQLKNYTVIWMNRFLLAKSWIYCRGYLSDLRHSFLNFTCHFTVLGVTHIQLALDFWYTWRKMWWTIKSKRDNFEKYSLSMQTLCFPWEEINSAWDQEMKMEADRYSNN